MKHPLNSKVQRLMDGEDYIHPKLLASVSRRQALESLGGFMGLALLTSCGSNSGFSPLSSTNSTSDSSGSGVTPRTPQSTPTCSAIPNETEGPYPASQLLSQSWIYRSDITEDRAGTPLSLKLNIIDVSNSCAPIQNAAVYIWHCDKDGNYAGYNNFPSATFLRGVQVTDRSGAVTFKTIYPGWYAGRITHIHFEVFLNNNLNARPIKISQLAFPQTVTEDVYNLSLYKPRGQNTTVASFVADSEFRDGVQNQLVTIAGYTSSGFTASLNVGI